jgi:ribosomal protein L11 methyltransferase
MDFSEPSARDGGSNRGDGAVNMKADTTTFVVRFPSEAADAPRLTEGLAEALAGEAAVAAFQAADGGWTIEIHFALPPDREKITALVAAWAGPTAAQDAVYDTVAARDWVAASLQDLPPVRAGRFVVHGRHDRHRVAVNAIGIEIEAGLAFGTGHHGTTRACLLALDRIEKMRKARLYREKNRIAVLDVGTGSGVLAFAAGKSLRCRVLASDIDPQAVRVARENARLNRAGGRLRCITTAGLTARTFHESKPYDLVFANILLEPLKLIARPMARLVRRGARVVLSGLLPNQANAALAAYRAHGFVLTRRIPLDGWMTLMLAYAGTGKHDRPGRRSGAISMTKARSVSRV